MGDSVSIVTRSVLIVATLGSAALLNSCAHATADTLAPATQPVSAATTQPWALRIELTQPDHARVRRPVALAIVLENQTDRELVTQNQELHQFHITVVDEEGNQISLTRFGEEIWPAPTPLSPDAKRIGMHRWFENVEPHGKLIVTLPLSRAFDLSIDGLYTVYVWRDVVTRTLGFAPQRVAGSGVSFRLISLPE